VDSMRIAQVLGNLLTNAAKYTPPEGKIRLSAERAGGAVLVRARVAPEREPASLLMVRGEAGWRLREVFD